MIALMENSIGPPSNSKGTSGGWKGASTTSMLSNSEASIQVEPAAYHRERPGDSPSFCKWSTRPKSIPGGIDSGSGNKSGKLFLLPPRNNSDGSANVQGNGIPCSVGKIPCSAKKIPCSFRLRELGCKPLIYRTGWTRKTPQRGESEKIPC